MLDLIRTFFGILPPDGTEFKIIVTDTGKYKVQRTYHLGYPETLWAAYDYSLAKYYLSEYVKQHIVRRKLERSEKFRKAKNNGSLTLKVVRL